MKDPGICPHCGSGRVRVIGTRMMDSDARGRERICRECRKTFNTVVLTEVVGGTLVTIETIAPIRPASVWPLRRLIERIRTLL